MRIEQTITAIGNRIGKHRDTTKPMATPPEQKVGDWVELSLSKSRIDALPDVRGDRLEGVRERMKNGFYDRLEVREGIAEAFLRQFVQ